MDAHTVPEQSGDHERVAQASDPSAPAEGEPQVSAAFASLLLDGALSGIDTGAASTDPAGHPAAPFHVEAVPGGDTQALAAGGGPASLPVDPPAALPVDDRDGIPQASGQPAPEKAEPHSPSALAGGLQSSDALPGNALPGIENGPAAVADGTVRPAPSLDEGAPGVTSSGERAQSLVQAGEDPREPAAGSEPRGLLSGDAQADAALADLLTSEELLNSAAGAPETAGSKAGEGLTQVLLRTGAPTAGGEPASQISGDAQTAAGQHADDSQITRSSGTGAMEGTTEEYTGLMPGAEGAGSDLTGRMLVPVAAETPNAEVSEDHTQFLDIRGDLRTQMGVAGRSPRNPEQSGEPTEWLVRTFPMEGQLVPLNDAGDLSPGTKLLDGRFTLEKLIKVGGMGTVYQALDEHAHRRLLPNPRVAIKVLNAQLTATMQNAESALHQELAHARELTHPNIVRVHEFYGSDGLAFFTMELLTGRTWDELLKLEENKEGLPLADARRLIDQLFSALSYAHDQGIVHSDLKPSNLFLTNSGQVKVLDFGIAAPHLLPPRGESDAGATSNTTTNTTNTSRPRQFLSKLHACLEIWLGLAPDPADDVYSTACLVYELLTGRHPYATKDHPNGTKATEALNRRLVPVPVPCLTEGQNKALRHALELERSNRTPSIRSFAEELWKPETVPQRIKTRLKRTPRWVPWLGGVAAAGSVAVAFMQSGEDEEHQKVVAADVVHPKDLAQRLRLTGNVLQDRDSYPEAEVLEAVAVTPRTAVLGSSPGQIDAALALCAQFSHTCALGDYEDEITRTVTLQPFAIDATAVTVAAFADFVSHTGYKTDAERAGRALAQLDGSWIKGGSWRNAVMDNGRCATEEDCAGVPAPGSAVVAVDFADAQAYCHWRGARLPTEDEWEYAARGPEGRVFAWGDDPKPASVPSSQRPAAADGPAEGVDGSLRGLTGNVWEWVDTVGQNGGDHRTLKGGSFLEQNAANKRAATRRSELASTADPESGFRCARTVPRWPDAQFWVTTLHPASPVTAKM